MYKCCSNNSTPDSTMTRLVNRGRYGSNTRNSGKSDVLCSFGSRSLFVSSISVAISFSLFLYTSYKLLRFRSFMGLIGCMLRASMTTVCWVFLPVLEVQQEPLFQGPQSIVEVCSSSCKLFSRHQNVSWHGSLSAEFPTPPWPRVLSSLYCHDPLSSEFPTPAWLPEFWVSYSAMAPSFEFPILPWSPEFWVPYSGMARSSEFPFPPWSPEFWVPYSTVVTIALTSLLHHSPWVPCSTMSCVFLLRVPHYLVSPMSYDHSSQEFSMFNKLFHFRCLI